MNVVCPACSETVALGAFRAGADGIHVGCTGCGAAYFVSVTGEVVDEPAAELPVAAAEPGAGEMRCPKCFEVQPQRDACRVCGLRATLFEDFAGGEEGEVPESLRAAWQRVEDAWDDDQVHDAFIEAAAAGNHFAYAARRYRAASVERPGDGKAAPRLQRLTRMAEAALLVGAVRSNTGQDEGKTPYRSVIVLMVGLLLISILGIGYMIFKKPTPAGEPALTPAPAQLRAPPPARSGAPGTSWPGARPPNTPPEGSQQRSP